MGLFYSAKKLNKVINSSIEKADAALSVQDTTTRVDAVAEAKNKIESDKGGIMMSTALKGVATTAALIVGGMLLVTTSPFVAAGLAGFSIVTAGLGSMFKTLAEQYAIGNKVDPIVERCETEISDIFSNDRTSFMKSKIGQGYLSDLEYNLTSQFGDAAEQKQAVLSTYNALKQKAVKPATAT